jgi:o-succinylbenzoate synthase
MKIEKFNWLPLDLNFVIPFHTSKSSFNNRRIYLIQLVDSNNNKFYGECAPLPGFGSESLSTVEQELNRAGKVLRNLTYESIYDLLENILDKFDEALTVRSVIEQALLQAIHFYNPEMLWNFIPEPIDKKIDVNGLIDLHPIFRSTETALVLKENGFNAIKLKAGRENFNDDLDVIKKCRKILGDDIKLRIDVNGKWSLNEAAVNLERLNKFKLQYVEQPVSNIDELIQLANDVKVPIAADESIRNISDAEKIISSNINFIVLKPALIGGVINSLSIIKKAAEAGKQVIISSSFESAIGRNNLLYLASIVNDNAHGITLSNNFKKDVFDDNLKVENGKINFSKASFPLKTDLSNYFSR